MIHTHDTVLSSPDPSVVIQFAHSLLSLDAAEQLTSVITQIEEETREKIPSVEQEWEGTLILHGWSFIQWHVTNQ